MASSTKLNVVVAVCNNMGIGIEGRLPWRLKKDMAFFKQITLQTSQEGKKNMLIMGKNTWLSIPPKFRPLAGRVNVILSSQMAEVPEGAMLARSFDEAVKLAESKNEVESVFVIGGSSVYKKAVSSDGPCRVYLTRVAGDFDCDTFFPELDPNVFKKIENPDTVPEGEFEEGGVKFSFEVHEKN